MSQVLTPEEMAALFEGLRETVDEPGSIYCDLPEKSLSRGRVFSEGGPITGCHNLSDWLLALADLPWPHL
jgi:hypothetical protein